MTAVYEARLEAAQIDTIDDLQLIVPSITFGNDFNMAKLFIRGVDANTSTTGSEPGVALHVDGAVVARAETQRTSLFDTVELWGKNLTDELVEASALALSTARTIGVTYLPPRTYGITFGYRF